METAVIPNGTRVLITHTFGHKWLQAEYGDAYNRVYGVVVARSPVTSSYKVELSPAYSVEVHELELEVEKVKDE